MEKFIPFSSFWVFEVFGLVKIWQNCLGVLEVLVFELLVVDFIVIVGGHGIC